MILEKRTILLTGGTSGIGRILLEKLVDCNSQIIVLGRNTTELERLEIEYDNVHGYTCDLSNKASTLTLLKELAERYPDVSVVFNNAAIQRTPKFTDENFCFDTIEEEITVNLMAPIWICSVLLKGMVARKEGAAFINVTSGLAIMPKTNSAVYCATKAGLHSFSKSFRYQLESTRVKVFEAVLPVVDTPMTEGRGSGKISAEKAASAIIKGVERGKEEMLIGKVKMMPIVHRLSPRLLTSIMKSA
ncbi:SDR family oxidoreductase [Teredinibacter purpureus]|jgi:Short-chain dehydrogenase involved in D-alanine esterification of lipoteichoic acid and wall teichoic acid (D-alanine transfer protein)|uniref:SDR family oxidoreductase n=1 Tax=Teredinibacter purpureus TaxID=2731756 RepID=UPI0005F84CF8|nr:SDR family NAD(P)-dependent oxidoreductase [Teredinibacter purpureus]